MLSLSRPSRLLRSRTARSTVAKGHASQCITPCPPLPPFLLGGGPAKTFAADAILHCTANACHRGAICQTEDNFTSTIALPCIVSCLTALRHVPLITHTYRCDAQVLVHKDFSAWHFPARCVLRRCSPAASGRSSWEERSHVHVWSDECWQDVHRSGAMRCDFCCFCATPHHVTCSDFFQCVFGVASVATVCEHNVTRPYPFPSPCVVMCPFPGDSG
jgi:hypothetical protein